LILAKERNMSDKELLNTIFFTYEEVPAKLANRLIDLAKVMYERLEELEEVSINEEGNIYWCCSGEKL
jgi:hypothetical protein